MTEPSPFAGPPVKIQPPDARLCPRCHGMLYLAYDVPPGHKLFSATTPCPVCACRRDVRHEEE